MFVNPLTGRFSSSTYLGSDTIIDQLPVWTEDCCCATCDDVAAAVAAIIKAPSELPHTCCGEEDHNPTRGFITFNGENGVVAPSGAAPYVLVPEEVVTLAYDKDNNVFVATATNVSRLQMLAYSLDGVTFNDITGTLQIPGDYVIDAANANGGTTPVVIKALYSPLDREYTFNFTSDGSTITAV